MLHEYAIEPKAIGSSWEAFRYVIEKFGFDEGRLISEFPRRWLREVYDATSGLPPIDRKRVEESLNQAKRSIVRSGRPYDGQAGDWLHNARTEHQRSPFRAIIASENVNADPFVLLPAELSEQNPLLAVLKDCAVNREAPAIAAELRPMLRYSSRILFIDPFYDPYNARYKSTFRECLQIVANENPRAVCEVHYRHHDNKPGQDVLEREALNLFGNVLPAGLPLTVYCWKQREGGADFHARYLLTDRGGIGVDAGFSAEGNHQTTDMHLMSFALSQQRLQAFDRKTAVYDLVGPVLVIEADGSVTHG